MHVLSTRSSRSARLRRQSARGRCAGGTRLIRAVSLVLVILALWGCVMLLVLALCVAAARSPSIQSDAPPPEDPSDEDAPVAVGVAAPE